MRRYSSFQLPSMIGRLRDLADQGETSIDASGSIPTPNATDTRINPIETITVHTMNVRWDASGDVFARSRVGEFFRSSTAPSSWDINSPGASLPEEGFCRALS